MSAECHNETIKLTALAFNVVIVDILAMIRGRADAPKMRVMNIGKNESASFTNLGRWDLN